MLTVTFNTAIESWPTSTWYEHPAGFLCNRVVAGPAQCIQIEQAAQFGGAASGGPAAAVVDFRPATET